MGVALAAQAPPSAADRLVEAAVAQTRTRVTYDGSYRRIAYPGGDVPESIGVCTDVVIRAYRRAGIDLQVKVHEDMKRAFRTYPQSWGMSGPDPNIDHRRVPNLQAFFRRAGAELPVSRDAGAYRPGDIVTWMLPRNLPHIGIVTAQKSGAGRRSSSTTSAAAPRWRTCCSRIRSRATTDTRRGNAQGRDEEPTACAFVLFPRAHPGVERAPGLERAARRLSRRAPAPLRRAG